jgi:hypothetical protein
MENQYDRDKAELYDAGARAFADGHFSDRKAREIAKWEIPDYDDDPFGRAFVLAARDRMAPQPAPGIIHPERHRSAKIRLKNARIWLARPGRTARACGLRLRLRLALAICYDLEFPEWMRRPALDGADLLAAPVNWPAAPRPPGERPARSAERGGRPGVYAADCDLARARDKRASARNDLLRDRRTDLYGLLPCPY